MRKLILLVMVLWHYLLYKKKHFTIYQFPFSIQKRKHYQPLWEKVNFNKVLDLLLLMSLVLFFLFSHGTVHIFTAKHNYWWVTKKKEHRKVKYKSPYKIQEEGNKKNASKARIIYNSSRMRRNLIVASRLLISARGI